MRLPVPNESSNTVVIKSTNPERIDKEIRKYVRAFRTKHPEIRRIIWFGSWVNGIPGPWSDVDVCLILSHSELSPRNRIPRYLPSGFPVGIDLFPYTE
jgi:predicted nucleotidyltransferase